MKLTYIKPSVTRILFILLFALSNNVFAQNKEIKVTGTIYDATGITLPSVTVTCERTKRRGGFFPTITEKFSQHGIGRLARLSSQFVGQ